MTADKLVAVSQNYDSSDRTAAKLFLITCMLLRRQITADWWNVKFSKFTRLHFFKSAL